jgi:hypothetical protein
MQPGRPAIGRAPRRRVGAALPNRASHPRARERARGRAPAAEDGGREAPRRQGPLDVRFAWIGRGWAGDLMVAWKPSVSAPPIKAALASPAGTPPIEQAANPRAAWIPGAPPPAGLQMQLGSDRES